MSVESQPEFDLEQFIEPSRYNRIGTISRVTAYVLKFVRNLQSRCRKSDPVKGSVTTEKISILMEKTWFFT